MSDIITDLEKPPYGVKKGVVPILLAVYVKIHEQSLSCYENSAFMIKVTGIDFQRIIKAPETFEIQLSHLSGICEVIITTLIDELKIKLPQDRKPNILDIVKPLCEFAAQLTAYSHRTMNLSETAFTVRNVLMTAKEPAAMLFQDLPVACGFQAFTVNETISTDSDSIRKEDIKSFSLKLKESVEELNDSYVNLIDRMERSLLKAFSHSGDVIILRSLLSNVTGCIIDSISEPRLKGFCKRLSDMNLDDKMWLESLGNFICSKPPSRWVDSDEDIFTLELSILARRFRNVESIFYSENAKRYAVNSERISITKPDGNEINHIYRINDVDEDVVNKLEFEIGKLINRDKKHGITAISRTLWKMLSE
ncbi:MAG: hypothetical protein HQK96_16525 [Nitrospirae bacterium]|nr:hypothetical protein [Nitrospirota bacterium]